MPFIAKHRIAMVGAFMMIMSMILTAQFVGNETAYYVRQFTIQK
jgi:hypothetical protein